MIAKGNKNVIDIFYGDKSIYEIYKGDTLVFSKRAAEGTGTPTVIAPLTLDPSISDPTKMVEGILGKDGDPKKHVVSWIRANSHRYVGTYDAELGMVLKQLDDNDSTKYADGANASIDITTKDVFMKMPDFWFRGGTTDDKTKHIIYFNAVEPTDGNSWVKWDGNTLIGAYKAVCQDTGNNGNGELYSRSGVKPTVSVSQENFKAKARNRSNGNDHFTIVTYEAHQVMALLYIAYYGDNMNAQSVIGQGTSGYPKVTGQTNADGMNDTVAEKSRSINFWGLENWWGDIDEWVDNLITYDTLGGINILNYDGGIDRQIKVLTGSGNITKLYMGEKLDMIPANMSGSNYTSYYCDYGQVVNSPNRVALRSNSGNGAGCGPFYFYLYYPSSPTSSPSLGTRLQYHGRVTIEEPTENSLSNLVSR